MLSLISRRSARRGDPRKLPNWLEFLILSLATWRVASIIANEAGPFDVFQRLRTWAGEYEDQGVRSATTWYGKGLVCLWCLSCHVGIFFFVLYLLSSLKGLSWLWLISIPFALSAVAIMVDSEINK